MPIHKKLRILLAAPHCGNTHREPYRTRQPLGLGCTLNGWRTHREWKATICGWGWEGNQFVVHVQ